MITRPCMHCTKMLLNTSAQSIYFIDAYPGMVESEALWIQSTGNKHWEQVRV